MKPGSLAYDEEHQCVGVFMDVQGNATFLRPIGGGIEWSTAGERVRPATGIEIAAAHGGLLNAPSPRGLPAMRTAEPCTLPSAVREKAGRQDRNSHDERTLRVLGHRP
jgi:hypothetical protein